MKLIQFISLLEKFLWFLVRTAIRLPYLLHTYTRSRRMRRKVRKTLRFAR